MKYYVIFIWTLNFVLLCCFILSGCATVYPRHPILKQILKPRTSYNGLTNSVCREYGMRGNCKDLFIVNHDLNDKKLRDMLIDFRFICQIAGRRFKIDPDNAGFARYEKRGGGFFGGGKVKIVERLPISRYQYLLDADTHCYSEKIYPQGLR